MDAAKEKIRQEILALEQSKVDVLRKNGEVAAQWFERHFADDIIYTSGNGAFYTKAETVDEFRTGNRKIHLVTRADYRVNVYGDRTAVLSYEGDDIMERYGKVGKKTLVRTTDVYVKQPNGVWQIVVHHVTPIQKS